jgi:hypothetical protein
MFPVFWRYFRDNGSFPSSSLFLQLLPTLFFGFVSFVTPLCGLGEDYAPWAQILTAVPFLVVCVILGFGRVVPAFTWALNHIIAPLLFGCIVDGDGGTHSWLGRHDSKLPVELPPPHDSCGIRFFQHDSVLSHIVSIVVDGGFAGILMFWTTQRQSLPFPLAEILTVIILLLLFLAVCHLLVLLIFILRRGRQTDIIRDFLGRRQSHLR